MLRREGREGRIVEKRDGKGGSEGCREEGRANVISDFCSECSPSQQTTTIEKLQTFISDNISAAYYS